MTMTMTDAVRRALQQDRTIDITTTGRKSGKPTRIETWLYPVGDRFFLTGTPGRRDWNANLIANPAFTLHLKQSTHADLAATAAPITAEAERRTIIAAILASINRPASDLDPWVAGSPLIEITLTDA